MGRLPSVSVWPKAEIGQGLTVFMLQGRRSAGGQCSGRDARFIARPPPRTVRAAFPHTACMGVSLSRVHHAIFVVLCCFILLFDPCREHSSIPTAHCRRRRAQRRSRTALLQRRRRLVLDGREHGGRLLAIGWSAAQRSEGSLPLAASNRANHACIRLNPHRVSTMKQSYASRARLRGGGSILPAALQP